MESNNPLPLHTITWYNTWKSISITPFHSQQVYGNTANDAQNYFSVLTTLEFDNFTSAMHNNFSTPLETIVQYPRIGLERTIWDYQSIETMKNYTLTFICPNISQII